MRAVLFKYAICITAATTLSGCFEAELGGQQSPDPIIADLKIAYVKRTVPVDNQNVPIQLDTRDPIRFNAGGDLYVRDQASPSAPEHNVTFSYTGGLGDVKDLDVSYDGSKVLFAMRAPEIENADEADQPTWNIWELDLATYEIRQVISDPVVAEAGQDIAPHYLPDDRIVFSSTRQRRSKALLLDEGKPQFAARDESRREQAFVLHVMSSAGSDIEQISFNQSHDLDPTVLQSGEILFSRWDHMGSQSAINLYKIHPDGTELQLVYGSHSHATGTNNAVIQFLQPRETDNGQIMTIAKPFTGTYSGGDIVSIDVDHYVDNTQPTFSSGNSYTGPGQTSVVDNDIRTDATPSPGGRYASAFPLHDGTNRVVTSWSPCRLEETGRIVPCTEDRLAATTVTEAAPLYGIFVFNPTTNSQLPIVAPEEGFMFSDVVAASRLTTPTIIADKTAGTGLDQTYIDDDVGVLDIRSVYDIDGTFNALDGGADPTMTLAKMMDPTQTPADQRTARFLRVVKAVGIPGRPDITDNIPGTAFGVSAQQGMRDIIGYIPIEPDGSVMVEIPADIPVAIDVLDKNGRRITARHQNWIQVRAGETVVCNGCHTHTSAAGLPHGHSDRGTPVNSGAATVGPFPGTNVVAQMGETMAQTRARITCAVVGAGKCSSIKPSVDVQFDDVWATTNAAAPFAYSYNDLTTAKPRMTDNGCQATWASNCRVTINYETHIHPLWTTARTLNAANVTCTVCHSPTNGANQPQIPVGQVDLTDGPSDDEPDHFKSYRELLSQDNEQELVNGVLQDRLVQNGVDANGNPIFVPVPAPPPAMSTAGARFGSFFTLFDTGGTHAGYLTDAEKRLIAEWLDNGAQYFNNPFDAPAN